MELIQNKCEFVFVRLNFALKALFRSPHTRFEAFFNALGARFEERFQTSDFVAIFVDCFSTETKFFLNFVERLFEF